MRELKFRAWDKRYKQMQILDLSERLVSEALIVEGTTNILKRNEELSEWMQYTGLTDENGVEIYDQDYFEAYGVKALVHYSVNHACWFWGSEKFSNATARRGEVIGNIYQNKELLK